MKISVLLLCAVLMASVCNAQFFGPKALPSGFGKLRLDAAAVVDSSTLTKNFFRPAVGISASLSNGTQLTGGIGISFQHNKFDVSSDSWAIQYSLSILGYLGTNGTKLSGLAGFLFGIPGTGGIVNVGNGYDFTGKTPVFFTGALIPL
jgi:hypothetical protein